MNEHIQNGGNASTTGSLLPTVRYKNLTSSQLRHGLH